MSTKDSDFKRKVEQAATIQLAASFLKIPQAMRAAGFTDEDSKSAAKQMQVRRARDAMQKSTRTNKTLAINTVTVLSCCLPAADSSVSTLTQPPSVPAGGGAVLSVLSEGVEDIVPAPPVLKIVRLTVGADHSAAIKRVNRGHAESNNPHEKVPHDQRGACHDR